MTNIVHKLKNVEDKIIFVCSSPYNVLIASLLIMKANLYGKVCIVMPTYSPKNLKYFIKLSKKLKKMNIYVEVINKHNILWRAVGLAHIQNQVIMKRILKQLKTVRKAYYLVNHTWDRAKVCYPASLYFQYCRKAIFIEEGCTQFVTPKEPKWSVALKHIYGNQTNYWKYDKLESIYVQNPERFIDYNTEKMCEFSLDVNLDDRETTELTDIFMNDLEKVQLQQIKFQRGGIIFTQCFSEDGFMTEEEKIRIYTELSVYYSQYGKVFLKVHPRDRTIYHIEGVDMIKGSYPSELFHLLNVKFDFAVGICTSAIETVNAKIKLNLNEKFMTEFQYELIPLQIS